MTQHMSDQQVISIRFRADEWQGLYEAIASSEDGKSIADRINAETIQPDRTEWEMAFTVAEWVYLASEADADNSVSGAVDLIDQTLSDHGWFIA